MSKRVCYNFKNYCQNCVFLKLFQLLFNQPVDAVFFNTSSINQQILVFSTARRRNGLVNSMGFMKVPEYSKDLLVLPIFPQTTLYQTENEQNTLGCYSVAGIKITPVIPYKEYRIEYNGNMHLESVPQNDVAVQLNAVWKSNLPAFNFSIDISKVAMSEAMALEPWTRQYFNHLKRYFECVFFFHFKTVLIN